MWSLNWTWLASKNNFDRLCIEKALGDFQTSDSNSNKHRNKNNAALGRSKNWSSHTSSSQLPTRYMSLCESRVHHIPRKQDLHAGMQWTFTVIRWQLELTIKVATLLSTAHDHGSRNVEIHTQLSFDFRLIIWLFTSYMLHVTASGWMKGKIDWTLETWYRQKYAVVMTWYQYLNFDTISIRITKYEQGKKLIAWTMSPTP